MAQNFKKYIITFLLLHLAFTTILLTGYKLFTDFTNETLAYLFWYVIIFGFAATIVQSVFFSLISSKVRLNKVWFFILVFVIELVLVNLLVVYANGGDSFTGDLISDIKYHNTWDNLSGSLIIHVALLLATIIISLARPIYKNVAV